MTALLHKHRHVVTLNHGTRYLIGADGGLTVGLDPLDAIRNGLAWASSEAAVARFKELRRLYPSVDFALALVTLAADPSDPTQWQAIATIPFVFERP